MLAELGTHSVDGRRRREHSRGALPRTPRSRCQRRGVHGVRHGPGERLEQTETMNHRDALVLEALREYHDLDRYGFAPPGHRRSGVASIPGSETIIGLEPFRADLSWPARAWMTAHRRARYLTAAPRS